MVIEAIMPTCQPTCHHYLARENLPVTCIESVAQFGMSWASSDGLAPSHSNSADVRETND